MAHTETVDGVNPKHEATSAHGTAAFKAELSDLASDAADIARHGASELRYGAQKAVDNAKHTLHDVEKATADAAASLKDVIARNPVASIGIAAGVGLILGVLVFRPRS